jgi:hypothetical protein
MDEQSVSMSTSAHLDGSPIRSLTMIWGIQTKRGNKHRGRVNNNLLCI